jgi:hypothetical protein
MPEAAQRAGTVLGEFAVAEVERFVAGEPLIGAVRADKLALLA